MLRRSLRLRSLVRPSMARQSLRQTRVPLSSKREQKVMFERRQRGQRQNNQQRTNSRSPRTPHFGKLALGLATAATVATLWSSAEEKQEVDYDAVRAAIADILDVEDFDDGSLGPILVRLAWHSSGTYDIHKGNGGSAGARMRFSPEADWGANAGLKTARDALEPIKKKFPGISYSDLWTLAGAVAIEEMGGPKITWSPGRVDAPSGADAVEDGRLPDATKGPTHVREIFSRMGFTDREMVALIGAHTFGRCHTQNSGFDGPWTRAPTTFSNLFFVELVQNKWKPRKWSGPYQYADPTGDLMMLPADMALIEDPSFRKYAELYAENQEVFAKDFASAFSKLLENGVPRKSSGPLTIAATIGALSAFGGFKK